MKRFAPFVLAALALGAVGCANDSLRSPTAPAKDLNPRSSVIFAACSIELHDQASNERDLLFAEPYLTAARVAWGPVAGFCSPAYYNLALAREYMLKYVQFTIDAYRAGHVTAPAVGTYPTTAAALMNHWNTLFAYVDYPEPNLPPDVLLPVGIAGVIFQDTPLAGRELKIPSAAALTVPVQTEGTGDTRGHLFTIHKLPGTCLASGNMVQTGPCYKFSANPAVSPQFDPKVKVGICQPVAGGQSIFGGIPALGHEDDGKTFITAPVGIYPTDCIDLGAVANAGSWTGGPGDIALKLASIAGRAIGVTPAYAAHGGLGGVSEDFSPFGAVDLLLFKATFTGDVNDKTPGPPEVGSWYINANKSSEIRVKKELGDLKTRPVVLDYHELKCGGCVGLTLRGVVNGAYTSGNGKYQVRWTSVSHGPDEDAGYFVIRDSQQREIARVTYGSTKKPKATLLQYNGNTVGTWKKDDKQNFEIVVDLDTKTTSLRINGVLVASDIAFVNGLAANIASIGAEFAGDTKQIGWDDITIIRLPDV